jgi:predicted nucleotidyltransferase
VTQNPHFILSVGTKVVALSEIRGEDGRPIHGRGAVGVVQEAPADYWHSYRVRFTDGSVASLHRRELAILSQFQESAAGLLGGDPLAEYDLYRQVIYRCIVGSQAFGLSGEESDIDRRGVYLPPAKLHWSLYGVPEQLENPADEEVYWEAQKFLILALKANPNVLECLYTPMVEHATPLAQELLGLRDRLLSKLAYQTYNGYVVSQFKKLQADLRNKGAIKWKHVMHLLRLLMAGITVLEEGRIIVSLGAQEREQLLAVRRGEMTFEAADAWRIALQEKFEQAYARTTLPDRPDYGAANDWLLKARRSMVEGE